MEWKKPLSKFYLSVKILIFAIGIGTIVIGVPVQLYDQHVITKGEACWEEKLSKHEEWVDNPKISEIEAACDIRTRYNESIKGFDVYSNKVLIDNGPDPVIPFYIGLFFIGLGFLVIGLKKWIVWLFR